MRFGPLAVQDCEGAILAHSLTVEGAEGLDFRKGVWLSAAHIRALHAAGIPEVIAARLDADDLHEDTAATHLAGALCEGGEGLRMTPARTGRVNLLSDATGVLALDQDAIDAANAVDPALTIATVSPWTRMGPGGLAVTVKVIPFAAPKLAVEKACDLARGAARLCPPQITSATLIETQIESRAPLPDKGRRATAARLERFSARLTERVVTPHKTAEIAAALRAAPGELLLILTASATCDAHDVAPMAVRMAGGEVHHFGMPVDPGNLLFIGTLAGKPVIGLPGCARSPALNGADWVIDRVVCGQRVTGADITRMGVGGLLKEIPSRPAPRRGTA